MVPPGIHYPRRVVVTGAASGIGQATALLLLERGCQVVAVDVDQRGLAVVADAGAHAAACDVADSCARTRLIAEAGDVDGLVNSAAIIRVRAVPEVTDEDWDAVLAVNLKAVFFLARDLGTRMRPGGAIVNVASVAAKYSASVDTLVYGASKAGVLSVTRSLAVHLGSAGVRVNAILPGITDTPMQAKLLVEAAAVRGTTPEALHEARLQAVPLGHRVCAPAEIAEAIVFLLSSAGSYVTGQALAVDGGFIMY